MGMALALKGNVLMEQINVGNLWMDKAEDVPHWKALMPATFPYHVLSLSLAVASGVVSY